MSQLLSLSGAQLFGGGSADLDQLFDSVDKAGKGIAFFIFPFPKKPSQSDFPIPELPDTFDGFLDFSEADSADFSPRRFNQTRHIFAYTRERILIFAVLGPVPNVFNWAQQWLDQVALIPAYKRWTKEAVWIPHQDIRSMGRGDPADLLPAPGETVDIDDPDAMKDIVYSGPTEREIEQILDEGPTDEDIAEMDRLKKLAD